MILEIIKNNFFKKISAVSFFILLAVFCSHDGYASGRKEKQPKLLGQELSEQQKDEDMNAIFMLIGDSQDNPAREQQGEPTLSQPGMEDSTSQQVAPSENNRHDEPQVSDIVEKGKRKAKVKKGEDKEKDTDDKALVQSVRSAPSLQSAAPSCSSKKEKRLAPPDTYKSSEKRTKHSEDLQVRSDHRVVSRVSDEQVSPQTNIPSPSGRKAKRPNNVEEGEPGGSRKKHKEQDVVSSFDLNAIIRDLKSGSTVLELNDNNLGPEAGLAIAEALRENTTLTRLELGNNNLGPAAGLAIGRALEGNRGLIRLDLHNNNLGPTAGLAIGRALEGNHGLTMLGLSNNNLGPAAGLAIGRALQENRRLTELSLDYTQLSRAGALTIAAALKGTKALTKASLSGNGFIDDDCAIEIANALSNLKVFSLSNTEVTENGLQKIKRILEGHRNASGNLGDNEEGYWYIDDHVSVALDRLLQRNNLVVTAPAVIDSPEIMTGFFQLALLNLQEGRIVVMPMHLNGNHWVGAVFRPTDSGRYQMIYTDPMGNQLPEEVIGQVSNIFGVGNLQIIDLNFLQQDNDIDCGPFMVDNLHLIARYAEDHQGDPLDRNQVIQGAGLREGRFAAADIRRRHNEIFREFDEAPEVPMPIEQQLLMTLPRPRGASALTESSLRLPIRIPSSNKWNIGGWSKH